MLIQSVQEAVLESCLCKDVSLADVIRTLQGVLFHPVKQEQGSLGNQTKALFSGWVWCLGAKDHGISDLD